jgi:hypothetical protein
MKQLGRTHTRSKLMLAASLRAGSSLSPRRASTQIPVSTMRFSPTSPLAASSAVLTANSSKSFRQ